MENMESLVTRLTVNVSGPLRKKRDFMRLKYILVCGLELFLFFSIILGIIITDFHIFQRGMYTTNQKTLMPN